MRVVVIGGSFGGLTAAFELRKKLDARECEITLIAKDERFVFIPSLPWVALGVRQLDQISCRLDVPLARRGIHFVHGTVQRIELREQRVMTSVGEYPYDFLVIATGHRSANEAVSGLGPFDGPGHSLMSPPEAEEARDALQSFLEKPGPMVIGCAPGASCIGPAYEFAFEIDHYLRQRKLRHTVPMVFVTPEPFLGHFGVGGMGKARQFLEGEFEARDIRYCTSAAVTGISESLVALTDGQVFNSLYSLIIPPLSGVRAVAESQGLSNPKGFIPVDNRYRHTEFPNVYAVGVAVAMPPVDATPVPVNFPKTGHMTEQMASIAVDHIAAGVQGGETKPRDLFTECILDMGNRGAHMKADPVRPPRNINAMSEGIRWHWAKKAFERYYLWNIRHGRSTVNGWGW